jgi:hypothetical protein
MKKATIAVLSAGAVLLAGCGTGGEPPEQEESLRDLTQRQQEEEDSRPLPDMPDYPGADRGQFAVQAASRSAPEIQGLWEGTGLLCVDPPMLQIIGADEETQVLVLLQYSVSGERKTSYPITTTGGSAPTPPASQVGVQLFRGRASYAYQGLDGAVDVSRFDELVSGRFAVNLRDITSNDTVRLAGAFRDVPFDFVPEEECLRAKAAMEEAPDSTESDDGTP